MRILFLLPCQRAEIVNGKLNVVGGGANNQTLSAFPGLVSGCVAMGLGGTRHTTPQQHRLVAQALDPEMSPLGRPWTYDFTTYSEAGTEAADEGRLYKAIPFAFEASKPGMYTLVFELDGSSEQVALFVDGPCEQSPGSP